VSGDWPGPGETRSPLRPEDRPHCARRTLLLADLPARPRQPAVGRRPPHRVEYAATGHPLARVTVTAGSVREPPHLASLGHSLALLRRCPSGRRQTFPHSSSGLDLPPDCSDAARGPSREARIDAAPTARRTDPLRGDQQLLPVSGARLPRRRIPGSLTGQELAAGPEAARPAFSGRQERKSPQTGPRSQEARLGRRRRWTTFRRTHRRNTAPPSSTPA
jgi:hypothetical protein